jgi:hypothetical protein
MYGVTLIKQIMRKNNPLPWREGIEGRGCFFTITLTPTLSRPGRGNFFLFISCII